MAASKLSKLTIFGYGLGHVCNDICASMWFTYLLLFFQKVFAISIIAWILDIAAGGGCQPQWRRGADAGGPVRWRDLHHAAGARGGQARPGADIQVGDVGPGSYFNIYQLLLLQKIRQAEESTSGWFPVCVALISLHIQPASGTDLRVRRR